MQTTLGLLFEHLEWAGARVMASLASQPETTVGPNVLRLVSHLVGSERVWLQRIHRREDASPIWPDWSLDEIRRTLEENAREFRELIAGLTESKAAEMISYRNSRGEAFSTRLSDILLHIALHGAYHRGQIAMALRADGVEPPSTDYIVFERTKRQGTVPV